MNAPRQIELTLRHKQASLAAEVKRLMEAFRELRKSAFWKSTVLGGIAVLEVTINAATRLWHPHLHLIVDGGFLPQKKLSAEWKIATGDSDVVWIQAVNDRTKTAKYVSKYLAKSVNPTSLTEREIREYASSLHGKRLIFTFGKVAKIVPEASPAGEKKGGFVHLLLLQRLVDAAAKGFRHADKCISALAGSSRSLAQALGLVQSNVSPEYKPLSESDTLLIIKTCAAIVEAGYLNGGGSKMSKRARKRLTRASGIRQSGSLFANDPAASRRLASHPAPPGGPPGPPPGGGSCPEVAGSPGGGRGPVAFGPGSAPLPGLPPPGAPQESPLPPWPLGCLPGGPLPGAE